MDKLNPFASGPGAATEEQMRMLYKLAALVDCASPVGDGVRRALEVRFGTPIPTTLGITRRQARLWIDELQAAADNVVPGRFTMDEY
jgi:hypothetical protein